MVSFKYEFISSDALFYVKTTAKVMHMKYEGCFDEYILFQLEKDCLAAGALSAYTFATRLDSYNDSAELVAYALKVLKKIDTLVSVLMCCV